MENINRKKIETFERTPLTFGVQLDTGDDRLDVTWFNPITEKQINTLENNRSKKRKLATLKTVSHIDGGKRLPKGAVITEDELNTIPYIRATDVKDLKVNLETAIKINKSIHRKIQNYQLRKDDIVITIVGTIGEVGILKNELDVCDFSENIARIRLNNNQVNPLFILHFLDSKLGKIQTDQYKVGSLQYKLSLKSCRKNMLVYLPFSDKKFNKSEQDKILNETYKIINKAGKKYLESKKIINEANKVVEDKININLNLQENKKKFETKLYEDPSSRLDVLFNNPTREVITETLKKYPYKLLGQIIKPQKESKIIPSDYYKLVELEQIDDDRGRIVEFIEVSSLGSKKILFVENSILISKLQPEKGKIVIVNKDYDGCVGSSELVPINLNSEELFLEYLWAVLRSSYVLKQWEYQLTGSSRMRIGWNEINHTIIPMPNKKKQEKIIDEINEKINRSDQRLAEANKLSLGAKNKFLELLLKY